MIKIFSSSRNISAWWHAHWSCDGMLWSSFHIFFLPIIHFEAFKSTNFVLCHIRIKNGIIVALTTSAFKFNNLIYCGSFKHLKSKTEEVKKVIWARRIWWAGLGSACGVTLRRSSLIIITNSQLLTLHRLTSCFAFTHYFLKQGS